MENDCPDCQWYFAIFRIYRILLQADWLTHDLTHNSAAIFLICRHSPKIHLMFRDGFITENVWNVLNAQEDQVLIPQWCLVCNLTLHLLWLKMNSGPKTTSKVLWCQIAKTKTSEKLFGMPNIENQFWCFYFVVLF